MTATEGMAHLVDLGELRYTELYLDGDVLRQREGFLSSASAIDSSGSAAWVVGDDQVAILSYAISRETIEKAILNGVDTNILPSGELRRILSKDLPEDQKDRKRKKRDFEALVRITRHDIEPLLLSGDPTERDIAKEILKMWPHGLMIIAGSGGKKGKKRLRSTAVVYALGSDGGPSGTPSKVSFEGLHNELDHHVLPDELNIEGMAVKDNELILAQRGNCPGGRSQLIRLKKAMVLWKVGKNLTIDTCDLIDPHNGVQPITAYDLGTLPFTWEGVTYEVPLHFTDLDFTKSDPHRRLWATAAAEAFEGEIDGMNAGSIAVAIGPDGQLTHRYEMSKAGIKFEGIKVWVAQDGKVFAKFVPDPDNPDEPARMHGALLAA